MTLPTASAVTWSMTSGGAQPHRMPCVGSGRGKVWPRDVECGHCGTPFRTTSGKARYCSKSCANNGRRQQGRGSPVACKTCGTPFIRPWPHSCYCTEACKPKRERTRNRRRLYPESVAAGPERLDQAANWCNAAPWELVESSWVPLVVDLYATDRNRVEMIRMLNHIRRRYRACSSVAAPLAVE